MLIVFQKKVIMADIEKFRRKNVFQAEEYFYRAPFEIKQ